MRELTDIRIEANGTATALSRYFWLSTKDTEIFSARWISFILKEDVEERYEAFLGEKFEGEWIRDKIAFQVARGKEHLVQIFFAGHLVEGPYK